jgi:hypothetical protein
MRSKADLAGPMPSRRLVTQKLPSKRPIKEVLEEGRDPVHAVYDAIEDKGEKPGRQANRKPACPRPHDLPIESSPTGRNGATRGRDSHAPLPHRT